jgi:hypothetical protein
MPVYIRELPIALVGGYQFQVLGDAEDDLLELMCQVPFMWCPRQRSYELLLIDVQKVRDAQ